MAVFAPFDDVIIYCADAVPHDGIPELHATRFCSISAMRFSEMRHRPASRTPKPPVSHHRRIVCDVTPSRAAASVVETVDTTVDTEDFIMVTGPC
jgi:hypothetical protein